MSGDYSPNPQVSINGPLCLWQFVGPSVISCCWTYIFVFFLHFFFSLSVLPLTALRETLSMSLPFGFVDVCCLHRFHSTNSICGTFVDTTATTTTTTTSSITTNTHHHHHHYHHYNHTITSFRPLITSAATFITTIITIFPFTTTITTATATNFHYHDTISLLLL